jgi:high-affinity K+ transport system ATPase subunit B
LAAVIAVIFVIIGGVRYITSQGDEDAALLAKNTIIYSILGVIVIALSAVIVNFLLDAI